MSLLPDQPAPPRLRWEIFCAVVDNYGDIGVCWRLARQLVREYGQQVRLWVDDLNAFARLEPTLNPAAESQPLRGATIRRWHRQASDGVAPDVAVPADLGDVVIEAFACPLPASLEAAMAQRDPPPVWLNLEYLSAEEWVEECHRMTSRHPRLGLDKHFFFPGFTPRTGGLLREHDLLATRRRFQAPESGERSRFLGALGIDLTPDEHLVTLFAYPSPRLPELFAALAATEASPTRLLLLDRPAQAAASAWAECATAGKAAQGAPHRIGALTLQPLPFLRQDDFDRLLWSADLNLVRGEDSFVRAQWAGRPFVWHIYPQAEAAHQVKLEAFLRYYRADLPPEAADALVAFWRFWNATEALPKESLRGAWQALLRHEATLRAHADAWCDSLARGENLAGALVRFCADRVK